ncbi:MAG: hypothetical protein D6785_02635 [Planctomycetota bacterium]|nr:MAG: hypothetical protein D6785_02635 [Planctomycetota bacterium]
MKTSKQMDGPRILLLGGHLIIFTILLIHLGIPNLLARRLSFLPIERDLKILKEDNSSSAAFQQAFVHLNTLHKLPKNIEKMNSFQKRKALQEWEAWWQSAKDDIYISRLNGLVFVALIFTVIGLAGLVYLTPTIWPFLFLNYCLNGLAFFILFAQYDGTSWAAFFAFAFALATFTLGYLARPEIQPNLSS